MTSGIVLGSEIDKAAYLAGANASKVNRGLASDQSEGAVTAEDQAEQHSEGPVAKAIEKQTAKLPSDLFLWAGLGSIALSAALKVSGRDKGANFVGHWAPTFLLLGVYNKIVKVAGSDRLTGAAGSKSVEPVLH